MTQILNLATHAELYVTAAELAAYWRVSDRAVHYWIAKGALKSTRVGRLLRIKTEDAKAFASRGPIEEPIIGPAASA